MNFTVWMTTSCNLRCKYCYEGENKPKIALNYETASSVVDFILSTYRESESYGTQQLKVFFHGGEPMMNYDVVKFMIERIRANWHLGDEYLLFAMTTNGTFMDSDKAAFLCENMARISLSIDGDKETTDCNRGTGVYEKLLETKRILCEQKSIECLCARITYNAQTVSNLYSNIRHLYDIGFRVVDTAPDLWDREWDENHVDILSQQWQQIMRDPDLMEEDVKLPELTTRGRGIARGVCDGGSTAFQVYPDGKLYPCAFVAGDALFGIGDVFQGINQQRVQQIVKLNAICNHDCTGCARESCCTATQCKLINWALTGDFHRASPTMCNIEGALCGIDHEYLVHRIS